MQKSTRFYLIGDMRVIGSDGEEIILRARKTRAILAVLCLADGKRVSRSRLIGLLWDLSPDAQARMSLRHALSELNALVNSRSPDLVEIDREWVRLNTNTCWIDALAAPNQFEQLLDDLDGISSAFDQWLASERARFEDRQRAGLEQDIDRLAEEDAAPQLQAAAARKLINFEPTHEGAVRSLIRAYVKMGDRAQAIREYERCRQALQSKLDLLPSKETQALYEAVRLVALSQASTAPTEQLVLADVSNAKPRGKLAEDRVIAHGPRHQPSIGVLPFRDLSAEKGQVRVGDGLVEDLIQTLSRVPNFFVISRLSTLAFRDQVRPPKEIGEALAVQYVLSGSIRVSGDRLRLTIELTETDSGAALLSSTFDEKFIDILEVQERLADGIVRRVGPHMRAAELKRTRRKGLDDLEAYDLFLRAQENMHNSSRAVFDTCEQLFDEVIARDPDYGAALAWRAYWHLLRIGQGWSPDPEHDTAQAGDFARRAIGCDGMEPMAFAVSGHIAAYLHKDFETAFRHFETALDLNPNTAVAWLWSGAARAWMGDGPRAIYEIDKAISLSPYDPLMYAYSGMAGVAYFADGQYDRAIEWALRSLRENKTYTSSHRLLVAAYQLAGQKEQARYAVEELLKLEPELTVDQFRKRNPSISPIVDLYCEALARAGVPASASRASIPFVS
jgi:TolB-like protein/DNA-binding SARP family transcriptional activator